MLLRKSIFKTKKFFQRTIQSFKSFMSNGSANMYHKLPKTPPFNPFSWNNHHHHRRRRRRTISYDMNYKEVDNMYTDFFTNQLDNVADNDKKAATSIKKIASPAAVMKQERIEEEEQQQHQQQEEEEDGKNLEKCSSLMREKRANNLVAEKLKEIVMMDVGDVEQVLDIEEVLHYYSRLTCPAYLDIVDKLFMDMYSEFFSPKSPIQGIISTSSRLRPRYR